MNRTLTNKADVLNRPIQHDDILAAFNLCNCGTVCQITHAGAKKPNMATGTRIVKYRTRNGWRTRKVGSRGRDD